MSGFGCCCAAGGPEFVAGAGTVDVEGDGGGGFLAVNPEGKRRGEGVVVGGAHDGRSRLSGRVFAAMSVGEAVRRFGWRLKGRHLVSYISRQTRVLRHWTRVAQGWRREAIDYYKPGLPFRKRWGDSRVYWSVQTAVGHGFAPSFFRGMTYRQIL